MTLKFLRVRGLDGFTEAALFFGAPSAGVVTVVSNDGRRAVRPLDDVPRHYIDQVRRWARVGRLLDEAPRLRPDDPLEGG